jgi:hypothetical protein
MNAGMNACPVMAAEKKPGPNQKHLSEANKLLLGSKLPYVKEQKEMPENR